MIDANTDSRPWNFIAMQYCWLILNRTYRVFVTENVIAGARVNGIIASPHGDPGQEWGDPEFYVKARLDEKYINVDPESDRFLKCDRVNFRIWRRDVVGVDFHPKKWGMGAVPYSGRLVVRTRDGRGHELILLGEQDAAAIQERLL